MAFDLVHALLHGGYDSEKLQATQKVQLYQVGGVTVTNIRQIGH